MNFEKKICDNCKVEKNLSTDFSLRKEKEREFYRHTCKKCRCEKEKQRRLENIDKFKERDKKYYENNKEVIIQRNKNYRKVHRNDIILQKKKYYKLNRKFILEYHSKNKQKRNSLLKSRKCKDVTFRLVCALKARIPNILRKYKAQSSIKTLACTKKQLVDWIEYQFDGTMTWMNYGKHWHIDHVIPVSFFDLTNVLEQNICFNWSNLRPLERIANISKSNKIQENTIIDHIQIITKFISLNNGYQTSIETCWWQRVKLWYGKNPQVDGNFKSFLKWVIRSEDPKTSIIVPKKYKITLKKRIPSND